MTKTLTIGKVSELTGLTARQLRYLEERGVLTPERTPGNQRIYPRQLLPLLSQIAQLRQEGKGTEEIILVLSQAQTSPNDVHIWFGGEPI